MIRLRMMAVGFALCGLWPCEVKATRMPPANPTASDPHGGELILEHMRSKLSPGGKPGRLYYGSTLCPEPNAATIRFPQTLPASRANTDASPDVTLSALKANDDPSILNRGGIYRIVDGKFSNYILNTKIHRLRIEYGNSYDPELVILAAQSTREVKEAEHSLGIEPRTLILDMLIQQPRRGFPHFPTLTTNRTFDNILDRVAIIFKGIVIFSDCGDRHAYNIQFIPLKNL